MKLGWPTTRTMVRTGGLITCTVGGFVTVVNSILASWPQPGAARAARSPEREPAAAGGTMRNRGPKNAGHQGPPGKGAVPLDQPPLGPFRVQSTSAIEQMGRASVISG